MIEQLYLIQCAMKKLQKRYVSINGNWNKKFPSKFAKAIDEMDADTS